MFSRVTTQRAMQVIATQKRFGSSAPTGALPSSNPAWPGGWKVHRVDGETLGDMVQMKRHIYKQREYARMPMNPLAFFLWAPVFALGVKQNLHLFTYKEPAFRYQH